MGALRARILDARILDARDPSRHRSGALTALLAVALTAVGVPAPALAYTAAEWSGSFTAAYADPAVVGLDQWSAVRFVVSQPLQNGVSAAWVVIRDAKGVAVTWCSSGTECMCNFNPAPGATETFTAQLGTARNGQSVVIDTAGPVSVTDIGWSGDFSYAYADNPSPAVDVGTYVRFGVTEPLNLAYLHVNDEMGAIVADCSQGVECVIPANPSPGEVKTYTARLRVQLNGHWVERSVRSVSVTDPGWNGTITPDANNPGFVTAGTQAWVHFTTVAPRGSADVKVYVDGVLRNTCNAQGGDLLCNANFAVGANEVHVVRADVVPYLIGGTQEVRASATSVVTSKTPDQLADFLLTATPVELEATLGTALATEVTAFQQATRGPSFCLALGEAFPTYRLGMTITDLTGLCITAGTLAVIAYLLHEVGFDATLQGAHVAADNPANLDPSDPNYPAGGGLNPDGTQCRNYDFDGNCIDTWYLGTQSAGAVTYAEAAPYAWTSGQMICRVQTTDPQTGEPVTVELDAEQLAHIIDQHLANVPEEKSKWDDIFRHGVPGEVLPDFEDKLLPEKFQKLIEFICGDVLTGTPASYGNSTKPETKNNKVWTYQFTSEVTTGTKGSLDTSLGNLVTVYIAPDGRVMSAHPGSTTSE